MHLSQTTLKVLFTLMLLYGKTYQVKIFEHLLNVGNEMTIKSLIRRKMTSEIIRVARRAPWIKRCAYILKV